MKTQIPKKFVFFGLPGSGKSTFAAKLSKVLDIPVYHLDKHYFVANWKVRAQEEFLEVQQALVNEVAWIIEGNSIATLETRVAKADVAIYFEFSRWICLWRVFKRLFFYDKTMMDTPEGCSKSAISWSLLKYLWTFKEEKSAGIKNLKQKYPCVDFRIFRKLKHAEEYLREITELSRP